MSKIKVKKSIFHHTQDRPFVWKDLKDIALEDDDILQVTYVEPYVSENWSYDGHYLAEVTRMVEETDEEYAKRIEKNAIEQKWAKERRYENYLRLKKEFEGNERD